MSFHESFWVAEAAALPVIALGQALSMPIATKIGGTPIPGNPKPPLMCNFYSAGVLMGYYTFVTFAVSALLGCSLASLAENKDEISVVFMSWATAVYLALTLITGSMLQLIVWQEKDRGAGLPD